MKVINFFDPTVNVQVIIIPREERGNESQLIKICIQPGNLARAHITGVSELVTSTLSATRSDPIPLYLLHLVPMWQHIIIQVLKMSPHPTLHHIDHLAVVTCVPAQ